MSPRKMGKRRQSFKEGFVQRESYVHGISGPPLIGKTIGAVLDDVLFD